MDFRCRLALVHGRNQCDRSVLQFFSSSALVPWGFSVDSIECDDAVVRVAIHAKSSECACPCCGLASTHVRSRYWRPVSDLPSSDRSVQLVVMARRFYCDAVLCSRRIFTERLPEDVLSPRARRTARLGHIIHRFGLALGGRPAAKFARRLMVPASNDTMLRVVRRRGRRQIVPPTVIGIDDWA